MTTTKDTAIQAALDGVLDLAGQDRWTAPAGSLLGQARAAFRSDDADARTEIVLDLLDAWDARQWPPRYDAALRALHESFFA